MADVIPLKVRTPETPAPKIWVCICGCSSFELMSDNTVRCALCQTVTEHGGWNADHLTGEWDETKAPIREIGGNGEADFARAVVLSRAKDKDVLCVAVVKEAGTLHVWGKATKEDLPYIGERLAEVPGIFGVNLDANDA